MADEFDRAAPLPALMQGSWVEVDDPSGALVIEGGEVRYRGRGVDYDRKIVGKNDGALTVDLKIDDRAREDAFCRENLTGLVIDPQGNFHAFNVKFASKFTRVS